MSVQLVVLRVSTMTFVTPYADCCLLASSTASTVTGAITKNSDSGSRRKPAQHLHRKYKEANKDNTLSGTLKIGARRERK